MTKRAAIAFGFLAVLVLLSSTVYAGGRSVKATGTIQKQGITTYMYGTHVLLDDKGKTLYALKSKTVRLDKYIGKKVTVTGDLVEGYPVDFGPDYLDVKEIKAL